MTEYQIQPHTRRCAVTGRDLQPGEKFYAVLLEQGDGFLRQDYSSEAWQGPPPGAVGFWCGRVPAASEPARPRFDDDLLEECFDRLEGQEEPGKVSFRYVLALLLLRRKRLKLEGARADAGREVLTFRCTRSRQRREVVNPGLTEDEVAAVQDEVFKVLGWE
jgi:hypothetical protein